MGYFMSLDPMALLRSMPGAFAQGMVWGLMAFLKASDERTYAVKRAGSHSRGGKAAGRHSSPPQKEMEDIYS